jgi:hypothetical protein
MNRRGESRILVLLQQPFGIWDDPDHFALQRSLAMNTCVAIIGGKAVLTFRAVDDDQADAMIDDQEGSVRFDLKVLVEDKHSLGWITWPLASLRKPLGTS